MFKKIKLSMPFITLFSFMVCMQACAQPKDAKLMTKANALAHKYIIVDTHQDVPERLQGRMEDISVRTARGNFDYPRAKQGGLDAVFMAAYVPPRYETSGGAKKYAENGIKLVKGLAEKYPDKFVIAKSPEDVRKQFSHPQISCVLCIENGSALEGDVNNIKYFYDLGARYITLCHSAANIICDSSFDATRKWNGLSPFGKQVVVEMNRTGMIIDVSHISDEAFYQVLELSKTPVIASHSSCRYFTPGFERNMSDDMIKALAKKGGVIQINFGSMFIDTEANKGFSLGRPRTPGDPNSRRMQTAPIYGDVSEVADHIDHVVKLVGVDYVGFGSDFEGVGDSLPVGLKDVSCYPNLIYELLKRGYSDRDIKKICSDNILRVWSQIEKAARKN
jgi:membrane dipeptidase